MKAEIYVGVEAGKPTVIGVVFEDQERYTLEDLALFVVRALQNDGHEVVIQEAGESTV